MGNVPLRNSRQLGKQINGVGRHDIRFRKNRPRHTMDLRKISSKRGQKFVKKVPDCRSWGKKAEPWGRPRLLLFNWSGIDFRWSFCPEGQCIALSPWTTRSALSRAGINIRHRGSCTCHQYSPAVVFCGRSGHRDPACHRGNRTWEDSWCFENPQGHSPTVRTRNPKSWLFARRSFSLTR